MKNPNAYPTGILSTCGAHNPARVQQGPAMRELPGHGDPAFFLGDIARGARTTPIGPGRAENGQSYSIHVETRKMVNYARGG